MKFEETPLRGSYIITLSKSGDSRGWFARSYCSAEYKKKGLNTDWVQSNHSFSSEIGTVRGLHYQLPPHGEVKLVRCIAGSVYDVIVDLRKDSPTFLKWFGVELSASNMQMLYIPVGFAHGFQTLSANSELIYQHSHVYTPDAEAGIRYNDRLLHIDWPIPVTNISERDAKHPLLQSSFKGLE